MGSDSEDDAEYKAQRALDRYDQGKDFEDYDYGNEVGYAEAPDKEVERETLYGIVGVKGQYSKEEAQLARGDQMIYPIEESDDQSEAKSSGFIQSRLTILKKILAENRR